MIPAMFPAAALAQSTNGYELSLYANYWDIKDGDDNVWGPGIAFAIPVYDKALKLDLRVAWFPEAGDGKIGDLELVPIDLGLSYHFMVSKEFDIYPMAGGNWTFANSDPVRGGLFDVDDNIGGYAGLGGAYYFTPNWAIFSNVYYRFLELDMDVESRLIDGNTLEADGINVDVGLRFGF